MLEEFGTSPDSAWNALGDAVGDYMDVMSRIDRILQDIAETFPTAAIKKLVATQKANIAAFLKIDKNMKAIHKKATMLLKAEL